MEVILNGNSEREEAQYLTDKTKVLINTVL